VTQRRDRFAGVVERADEVARFGRLPEQTGVDEAAGDQQPVIVIRIGLGDRRVDVQPARRLVQIDTPNLAVAQRDDVTGRAAETQGVHRMVSSTFSNPSAASTAIRRPFRFRLKFTVAPPLGVSATCVRMSR